MIFEKQNFLAQISANNEESWHIDGLQDEVEENLAKKDFKTARKLIQKRLSAGKSEDAYLKLGILENLEGDDQRAIKAYEECLRINPLNVTALINLGDIYKTQNLTMKAVNNYVKAINIHPFVSAYKDKLISVISSYSFKQINPNLKAIILACIKDTAVNISSIGTSWLSIVTISPQFQRLYKPQTLTSYQTFKNNLDRQKDISWLYYDFFLSGLKRIVGTNMQCEKCITYLRRYMLENLEKYKDDKQALELISALSVNCHLTEFIFKETTKETKALQYLTDKCESGKTNEMEIACLACYRPLSSLKNKDQIFHDLAKNQDLSAMLDIHIRQPKELEEIRPTIKSLTRIDDKTSSKVQSQYEKNPYPRWDGYSTLERPQDENLWGKKAKILNAGCGTGQEAINLAVTYPDAEITAVDLSLSSLSYAIMKAKQYGISNISFYHGDILKLGELDQKFDLITSSGVLHHMKDPLAGWQVLNSLMKPGGSMRIALYSKHARTAVTKARNVIAEHNLGSNNDTIKTFRTELEAHIGKKAYESLTGYRDFFSLSEFRDLIFHVQEHQFDIPEIKDCLDKLDLKFVEFSTNPDMIRRFKNKYNDEDSKYDLDKWHEFELKNPDTFSAMYHFVCERKQ